MSICLLIVFVRIYLYTSYSFCVLVIICVCSYSGEVAVTINDYQGKLLIVINNMIQFTLDQLGAPPLKKGEHSTFTKSVSSKGAKLFITLIDN